MKTLKRNLTERAFQHGYRAGLDGRRRDLCPHRQGSMREQWVAGWREGRTDWWDGFGIVPGIQKMALR
ncbi:MAG: ribosome modulation factor [Spongiibacteraceae bacterium]